MDTETKCSSDTKNVCPTQLGAGTVFCLQRKTIVWTRFRQFRDSRTNVRTSTFANFRVNEVTKTTAVCLRLVFLVPLMTTTDASLEAVTFRNPVDATCSRSQRSDRIRIQNAGLLTARSSSVIRQGKASDENRVGLCRVNRLIFRCSPMEEILNATAQMVAQT